MASEEQRKKWREAGARYRAAHRDRERERSRRDAAKPGYTARKRTEAAARKARDPVRAKALKRAANARLAETGYHQKRYAENPQRGRDAANKWTAKNRDKTREAKLTDRFGLTSDDYAVLLQKQDGKCAICALPERCIDKRTGKPRRLAVDHCHDTQRVRGLLCYRCNVGIGLLNHCPEKLRAAIAYLGGAISEVD